MNAPRLVQRYEVREGNLKGEYMGSTQYEVGDQRRSFQRLRGESEEREQVAVQEIRPIAVRGLLTITHDGTGILVYLLAPTGFVLEEYQPYLQAMADNRIQLQEPAYFDEAIKLAVGKKTLLNRGLRVNVWHDFCNDVIWSLDEDLIEGLQLGLLNPAAKV